MSAIKKQRIELHTNIQLPDNIEFGDVNILLIQDQDSCCNNQNLQELKISLLDAGAGHYIVLKTSRWAIDPEDIDKLCVCLKNFVTIFDKRSV